MKKLVEAYNLIKEYERGVRAVDDISFSLYEGEILGILGPNGAGKTTTLQMLMGILKPTSGKIFLFGKELEAHREEVLSKINFSSTYVHLPWKLTVEESLKFISFLYPIEDRKSRLEKIKRLFRLEEIWKKRNMELSAGQLSRVSLAKALINFPKVLFLDEPTASLDPEVAFYIRKFLLEEREKFGVSIILTSHNMAEVEELCDRVIFLHKGKIIDEGPPEKLSAKIKTSHLTLMIADGLKRTIEICKKHSLKFSLKKRHITIDIDEKKVAWFLNLLARKSVEYEEISIEKPDLEDYFLAVAGDKENEY